MEKDPLCSNQRFTHGQDFIYLFIFVFSESSFVELFTPRHHADLTRTQKPVFLHACIKAQNTKHFLLLALDSCFLKQRSVGPLALETLLFTSLPL